MGKAARALAVGSQPLLANDYAAISWTDGLLNAATFAVEAWRGTLDTYAFRGFILKAAFRFTADWIR
jgi:hypothetical protein